VFIVFSSFMIVSVVNKDEKQPPPPPPPTTTPKEGMLPSPSKQVDCVEAGFVVCLVLLRGLPATRFPSTPWPKRGDWVEESELMVVVDVV